jgi:4-hydroxy-tetrahydrodipicolinate synthase
MTKAKYGKGDAKAVAREVLRGIFTALCLPVDERGGVDEAGFRHDLRHCIDVIRADGLYINGYYGHFWLLSSEQRRRVIEIAVDEAAGAVPIINRCAHPSPAEAIALARHSQELGVDFISLVIPQFGGAHESILLGYFAMIAREIDLGITIFNTDQAGYTLSPEMMARLAEIPNVCALKNGMRLEHTARVRELVGDSIVVVDPDEENLMVNMAEGGQKTIYTGTNMMFDSAAATPMRDYVHAALAGRFDEARRLFERMQPARDLHHRWVLEPWGKMGVCPVSVVKYWTQQLGMAGGPTPEPLPDLLSADDKKRFLDELSEIGMAGGMAK